MTFITTLLSVLLFVGANLDLGNAQVTWTYSGVDRWGEHFPVCNGNRQSPINIEALKTNNVFFPPLTITRAYFLREVHGKLFNKDGLFAEFEYESCKSSSNKDCLLLSGGPLKGDSYLLKQFHFHWGADSSWGSEHTVNGFAYPAELHLVHFNTKYEDAEVTSKPDGIAVIGIFLDDFQNTRHQPRPLDIIEKLLGRIILPDAETNITIRISDLFGGIPDLSDYFTYPGSLTTPPCSEAVTWVVFRTPIQVSRNLLKGLRDLVNNEGNRLVDNFRPTQKLGRRRIVGRNAVFKHFVNAGHQLGNGI